MAQGNKTEKPTPRRLQKAREQGQVARSRDLANALAGAAAVAVFVYGGSMACRHWQQLLRATLDVSLQENLAASSPVLLWNAWGVARWVLPFMLAAWAVAVGSSVAQGGVVFASGALTPKLERFSPANKLAQMFSLTALAGLLKSLLPFFAIIIVAANTLNKNWAELVRASLMSVSELVGFSLSLMFTVAWKSGLILLVWAAVDYLLVWRKLHNDLMMSHEEIREEFKETDGNPAIKARIRRLQRQVRRQQMMRDTAKATVVIANPTHFAIALRYEGDMDAPIVVAKGRDLFAQKLKEIARWQGVPVVENPPLAQALYRTVEVGHSIPGKLYTAVAEILALVYRAQAQARQTQAGSDRSQRRNH